MIERLDATIIEGLLQQLSQHPSPATRKWINDRRIQADQETFIAGPSGYKLVKIPGGIFMIGSPESEKGRYEYESPLHEVHVPNFYMTKYLAAAPNQ